MGWEGLGLIQTSGKALTVAVDALTAAVDALTVAFDALTAAVDPLPLCLYAALE